MNFRKYIHCLLFLVLFGCQATIALAQEDIREHRSCIQCGMDRKAYGYSRMLIKYDDDSQSAVCSLHCAVVEIDANKGQAVKSVQVADRDDHILIEAEKAYWVIGGSKRGVMTKRPKWAFATEAAARKFITSYGGTLTTWAEAIKASREDAGLMTK